MSKDILIGIDGGTGGIRIGFYQLDGSSLGYVTEPYETLHKQPGYAEQNPQDWWEALQRCLRKGLNEFQIDPYQIAGLATATTSCSVVICKRDGTPVRDCLIWMDVRAEEEVSYIADVTGERLSPEWMPGKLLWLKKNERQHYDCAEVFCEYQDWLTFKLTGKWSININNSCNWGYNARLGSFYHSFYERIGLAEAVEKFPAEQVFAVGDAIGYVSQDALSWLGLPPDLKILVAQGGIDSSIGVLGMGVTGPGKIALITGSSNLAMALSEEPMFHEGTINTGPDNLYKGYYTSYRGQVSSGSIMAWFKREFCKDLEEVSERTGVSVYDMLNEQAAQIEAGSDGLLVLDYWQGNRHPHLDFKVRGLIYGYSLSHTRAHVYRAIMEGIAFGTENLLYQFRANNFPVSEINIAGGTSQSDLFLQIHADISNVKVNVPEDANAVCLGSAIAAAVALGHYPSLQEAVVGMVRFAKQIIPNEHAHAHYKKLFKQYQDLYPQLKDWMQQTTLLSAQYNK